MRPPDLNPLFAEASSLRGVGPKVVSALDRLFDRQGRGVRVLDLLLHAPAAVIDRRTTPTIVDAPRDRIATLEVRVRAHQPPSGARGKSPYKVVVEDDTGDVTLVFFLNNAAWVDKALPIGTTRWISGRLELWDGRLQMVHPDRVLDRDAFAAMPAFDPVYPLTEGLFPRVLARAVSAALDRVPELPEWHDPGFLHQRGWPSFAGALSELHRPKSLDSADLDGPAWQRLAFDELLASQLALALVRRGIKTGAGRSHAGEGRLAGRIDAALPFTLTSGQREALREIRADLAAPERMLRLLQGDVGSGKTVVATLAAAQVVEAGHQAALMAPTELLARQHFIAISSLTSAAGIRVGLLTGRDRPAERADTLEKLRVGALDIVIGTHALFGEGVAFKSLALVVVDEQHRFGVAQRLTLAGKGDAADLLVMTATPIPRTLVLTLFGDLDVSVLREKPAGRRPIDTRAKPVEQVEDVVAAVGRAIAADARIYWVCPAVQESESADLVGADVRYAALRTAFGDAVGLVHGQMKPTERDTAMDRFRRGICKVLVATTVIEVGVDVPEANIMVIEHAERFGLAQLHQLRGRVGRGRAPSSCLLLYKGPLGEAAKARIAMLRESEDGFRIAEEDLRLRGEGDVIGTRQSGLPNFRLARLDLHAPLLEEARRHAAAIVAEDPRLSGPRGDAWRRLLYLFERDAAVRLLSGG